MISGWMSWCSEKVRRRAGWDLSGHKDGVSVGSLVTRCDQWVAGFRLYESLLLLNEESVLKREIEYDHMMYIFIIEKIKM